MGSDALESNRNSITRRSFLQAAAPLALGLREIVQGQTSIDPGRFGEADLPWVRAELLKLVNAERAHAGLSLLQLDELACKVASEHALDMISRRFLSHWSSDGHKPYHRYSFAGGFDAVQENVSAAENIQSLRPASVARDLADMHASMYFETPPDDGHRRTILYPFHTHVGFGIALQGDRLRLDELYLSKYVEIDSAPQRAKPKAMIPLRGRMLDSKHELIGADVYYEPLPSPPSIDWLRVARPVGLPHERVSLRPRLPRKYVYDDDGSRGTIELDKKATFRVPVILFKDEPGIYTILVWLTGKQSDKPFPATELCIRSE